MENLKKLNILWTNADPVAFEQMVYMYAYNGKKHDWWDEVTLIIWGSTAKLVSENEAVQERIKEMLEEGVNVSACKACAKNLGVVDKFESLGIDLKYWGPPLTEILNSDEKLMTI